MKSLILPFFLLYMISLTGCSTTENSTEQPAPEEVSSLSAVPEWFVPNVPSETDSLSFRGYSLTSASDSTEAAEIGNQTAVSNLRFEIDSFLESIRRELVDGDSGNRYQEPAFIFELRNLVQDLDLSGSGVTTVFEPDTDEIYYLYTMAEISKKEVYQQVDQLLTDERFIERVLSDLP